MRSLTLTFTFRWLYLTQGQWARILTPPPPLIYCLLLYLFGPFLRRKPVAFWALPLKSFWLAAYLKPANINTSRENEGGEHHILHMTPSDSSSSTKGQLIPSLICQRRWRHPQIHTATDWWRGCSPKHTFISVWLYLKVLLTSQTAGWCVSLVKLLGYY